MVLRVLAWGSDEAYVAMRSKSSRYGGGVVCMVDGAVTFKGGSISNSTAVRACAQR